MDKALARYVAKVAFESSAALGDLIPLIKAHSSQDDFIKFAQLIASASAGIGLEVLNEIFTEHPEMKDEFDQSIQKYGKII